MSMKLYNTLRYYARKFGSYHISTYAASASFFIISALFPFLILLFSILSFFSFDTSEIFKMLNSLLPTYLDSLVAGLIGDLLSGSAMTLSISAVAVLWTAAKSMLGLMDGLNAISDVNDTRNFILKRIICIGYMLLLIVAMIITLVLRVFGLHIQRFLLKYAPHIARVFQVILNLRGLTLFFVIAGVILLIYTVFPNKRMRILLQIPGALFTSGVWLVFTELFSLYAELVFSQTSLYGSLGILILALLWLYCCMYIIFIGAVINRIYPSVFWRTFVVLRHRRSQKKLDALNLRNKP